MTAPVRSKKYTSKSKTVKRRKSTARKKSPAFKKFTSLLVASLVFLISIISLGGYIFVNKLSEQFVGAQTASSTESSYMTLLYAVLDSENKETPVIKSLNYKIYDFTNSRVLTYTIPPKYIINATDKYGDVEAEKLYALGLLEENANDHSAANFVGSTMFLHFASKVDRYLFVDSSESSTYDRLFSDGVYIPYFLELAQDFSSSSTKDSITNLSLSEIYQTAKFVGGLPDDRNVTKSIEGISVTEMDEAFREMTLDSNFAMDAKNIAILNASGKTGLATFGARVVKNLGGRVVSIDNADQLFSENFIVTSNPEDTSTNTLAKVFNTSKVITKEEAFQSINSSEIYRADIVVVLSK